MNLGENIYNYRTQKNMSQGDLADALEVSRQSVSKWENNSATPELDKLMKLAEIFEITLDELVSGEKTDRPAPPQTSQASQQQAPKGYDPAVAFLSIPQFLIGIAVFVFLSDHFISWWIGIPSLFAGVFIVLVGINAYFEKKKSRPAITPVPTQETTVAEPFPAKKIVGIILLCCGLICAIVCIILAYTVERDAEELMCLGLGLGIPLAQLGLCLLLVRKHTLLVCGWILFLDLWIVVFVLGFGSAPNLDTFSGVASLFTISIGSALSVGTLVQVWRGKLGLFLPWKLLLTALITLLLAVTLVSAIPPKQMTPEIGPAENSFSVEVRAD